MLSSEKVNLSTPKINILTEQHFMAMDSPIKCLSDKSASVLCRSRRNNDREDPNEPETSAQKVLDEAEELEDYIAELVSNMKLGIKPDFDEYFHFLDGKYKCLWTLEPMKSYGTGSRTEG